MPEAAVPQLRPLTRFLRDRGLALSAKDAMEAMFTLRLFARHHVQATSRYDVLLAPISAPWLKVGEAVDFVREVAAPMSLGIHDCIYSEAGLEMVERHMANLLPEGRAFVRRAPGEDL